MAKKGSCSSITRKEHFASWLINSDLNENQSDSTDDDINESGLKGCEWDSYLPDPEEQYHLPRSSPVISRNRCDAELKTEKQASPSTLCLTTSTYDTSFPSTSTFITAKSKISNPHGLEEFTPSEKLKEPSSASDKDWTSVSHKINSSPIDILEQSDFLKSNCGTGGISPVSQRTLILSRSAPAVRSRAPLNQSLESRGKRRACSDIPPASTQRNSGYPRKHVSIIDAHSFDDIHGCSLDQENAHFVVVDMVLEVMESVKWVVCLKEFKSNPCQDKYETQYTTKTDSFQSFDGGFEDDSNPKPPLNRYSLASFQCPQSSSMPCSAEHLAHRLVSGFRKQWFPSERLQNPDNLNITLQEYSCPMTAGDGISLTKDIKQKSRMRGKFTWAPPRFEIIYWVQPTHRRRDVIASQHFLCAGCGTEVEPRYIKKLRYCDYLGKYFCDGCHGGEESVIPGRVLSNWDFAKYPVCNFSRQLLDSIRQQPLFKLARVAKNLYNQAKELQRFRDLHEQLMSTKKLLSTCRRSTGVLADFEQLPAHMMQEPHLFSMDDLIRVKNSQLWIAAKAIFQSATAHIDTCELCQAKGFLCEFCQGTDVLFPFQRDTCTRCQDCRACFHISCFRDEACPKCARLQKRKKLQQDAIDT
ncbi:Protein RUBCNL-like [Triplophysa tibetana]|uniref:Protein RUBCNL-like n=1 Tax=Triplophysa tibetana TaxID=1572043 RepID=A0A5A9P283_9TELE|nr:Protein RUBCNL-like [Triplophysa tibetana]